MRSSLAKSWRTGTVVVVRSNDWLQCQMTQFFQISQKDSEICNVLCRDPAVALVPQERIIAGRISWIFSTLTCSQTDQVPLVMMISYYGDERIMPI
jgi:hypothetical protein